MKIKQLVCCIVLTIVLFDTGYGQNNRQYIDSINQYVNHVDSIIMEWSVNPESELTIQRSLSHFSNPQKEGICASSELYKESTNENLYRLSYSNNCDSIPALQDFYFYKTRIVLIRTASLSEPGKKIDQYYLDDEIINPTAGKLYLSDGYEILKKMSN